MLIISKLYSCLPPFASYISEDFEGLTEGRILRIPEVLFMWIGAAPIEKPPEAVPAS